MLIVAADQLTKNLARARLAAGESIAVVRGLRITRVETPARGSLLPPAIFAAVTAVIVLAASSGFFQRLPAQIGLGAAIGGAASNLFDRLRRGAITDFVNLGWWPVFNLADVAITCGVPLSLLFLR
ncbi:MAG: signal peptidase II [Bryobacteraceae bacterium]|nr:signal peptidase II [Bryobacteraceae bacterium]